MSNSFQTETLKCPKTNKPTNVFIKFLPSDGMCNAEEALGYLRDKAPRPIVLSPLPNRAGNLTLLVEVSGSPHIKFGRSAPTGDLENYIKEILEILNLYGISEIRYILPTNPS